MPDTANPTMDKWVPCLAKTVEVPDKDCYFVGHSLGCITILRYLETLKGDQKVGTIALKALNIGSFEHRVLISFEHKDIFSIKQYCCIAKLLPQLKL